MKKSVLWVTVLFVSVALFTITIESCNNKTSEQKTNAVANNSFEFKEKLSDYNFFSDDLKELKPKAALIHYELATPLFTDYAVKDRFVLFPKGKAATYKGSGLIDFPDSTIIIKNFAYNNEQHQKIMI